MDKRELEELLIRIALCLYGIAQDDLIIAEKRISILLIDARFLCVNESGDLAHGQGWKDIA